jgi:hypothetical protein
VFWPRDSCSDRCTVLDTCQSTYKHPITPVRRSLFSYLRVDTLEYIALHLLALLFLNLLDIDILPQENAANAERNEAYSTDDHHPHDVSIRIVDRISSGRAGILQLSLKAGINASSKVFLVGRQVCLETLVEHVCPHGSGNGFADRCADGAEEAKESEADGDFLVVDAGCDHQLAGESPDAAVDSLEELAHNEVSNISTGVTEVNQKCCAEDSEWSHCEGEVLG